MQDTQPSKGRQAEVVAARALRLEDCKIQDFEKLYKN